MADVTPAIAFGPPALAAAFAAGFVSFLSPCVLPLVPGYLSVVSGVALPLALLREKRLQLSGARGLPDHIWGGAAREVSEPR